jgi:D-alanyl-D-alanine carboxypeptidase
MAVHLPTDLIAGLHVVDGVDRTGDITIRHLLSHTAGLPDHWERPRTGPSLFDRLAAGDDLTWDIGDVIRWVRDDHRPHFAPEDLDAPRQRARYSDAGFQLLIAIVERATGLTYAAALQERIFGPLGLDQTWLPRRGRPAVPTPPPATVYAGRTPLEVPGLLASSNDLVSTTGDLLTFERALLAGALFQDPATVGLLTERANLLRNAFPLRYGLGTMRFNVGRLNAPGRRPVTLIGHSGATGTWLFTCPELGVHLAGSIDQASGKTIPFRIMTRLLRVWTGKTSLVGRDQT